MLGQKTRENTNPTFPENNVENYSRLRFSLHTRTPQSRPHWYPSPRLASPCVQCKHAHLYRSASAAGWLITPIITRHRPDLQCTCFHNFLKLSKHSNLWSILGRSHFRSKIEDWKTFAYFGLGLFRHVFPCIFKLLCFRASRPISEKQRTKRIKFSTD